MERLIDNTMKLDNNSNMTSQGRMNLTIRLATKILFSTTCLFALFLFYGCMNPCYSFSIYTTHIQYKQLNKDTWEITYRFGSKECELELAQELVKDTTIKYYHSPVKWIDKSIKVKADNLEEAKQYARQYYSQTEEFVLERIEYAYKRLRSR